METLLEAKRLYLSGLALTKVAIEVKVPYQTLHYHAWVQGWAQPNGKREANRKAIKLRREMKREEIRQREELAIAKAQDVEVLAQQSLWVKSARTRGAISEQVNKLVRELRDDEGMSKKEKAQTLNALANVLKVLHGIESEGGEGSGKGAINLALINTTPEQLKALGEGRARE